MPLPVGNGCVPAAFSFSPTPNNQTVRANTSPAVSVGEKIQTFMCSTKEPEAQELIGQICEPPTGTSWKSVIGRFEQLRDLMYPGYKDNVKFDWQGENHLCILGENNEEVLSVTFDDAGNYTVTWPKDSEMYYISPETELGEECLKHEERASGTRLAEHTAVTTAPQTAEEYDAHWQKWAAAAPPEEREARDDIVMLLQTIQFHSKDTMEIFGSPISSLPDHLPPCIDIIQIFSAPLLTCLPTLPDGVKDLVIYDTPLLTSLSTLPQELMDLAVVNTPLLTSLPTLPQGVRRLTLMDTPRLTSLPTLPQGVRRLALMDTPRLTSLQQSIAGLPREVSVYILNNSLSDDTLRDLRNMTTAPDYSGPTIHFSMTDSFVPPEPEPRILHLAVADWLTSVKEGEPSPADSWQGFEQEDNAAAFSAFLDSLKKTENFSADNTGFKTQIASWLTLLAEDKELRRKTFSMAVEATSSCEDRVTLAMNQMYNVQLLHNAETGVYNKNLPGLVSVGREMFRLGMLEKIAREKIISLSEVYGDVNKVEEIEVYLGYQNQLKDRLKLTTVTNNMKHLGVSGITKENIDDAEERVKDAENSGFSEWILGWEPLHCILKRSYPEDWEALNGQKKTNYDSYRKLGEEELKQAGLADDADAKVAIGAQALTQAELTFREGLRPLAAELLGRDYLKSPWS